MFYAILIDIKKESVISVLVRFLKPVHSFSSNTYLISSSGEYAVIDPSVPYSDGLVFGKLKYILLTHAHFDHMLEIDSWVSTGAKVIISEEEKPALSDSKTNCYSMFFGEDRGYFGEAVTASDGDELFLGEERIRVIGCPGHTAMGLSYYTDKMLFAGDNIFAGGGFGRWDLPGGNKSELKSTISRLTELPADTKVYCGHGPTTTMKEYIEQYKNQRYF